MMDFCKVPLIDRTVTINGAQLSGDVLAELLNMVTNPDPRVWYNFRRVDNLIHVTRRLEDQEPRESAIPA